MQLPHLIDIKNKYYKYARCCSFGNQLQVWNTPQEFEESGFSGPIGLRYVGKGSGAPWLGNGIPADCAVITLEILCEQEGYELQEFAFCEASPDPLLTLQGEVYQGAGGLQLRYSMRKCNMRKALATDQKHASGVTALYLLQKHLSSASYDDLQVLFDWFPGHVVEFSAFSILVGCFAGRNTVIWEVRKDGEPPGWYVVERNCRKKKVCTE